MDYDTMEAGREMDALVAEKVMGWKITHRGHRVFRGDINIEVTGFDDTKNCEEYILSIAPKFSSEIATAWEVVEKMWSNKWFAEIFHQCVDGTWQASFMFSENDGEPEVEALAPTAPLAICRAALKARGEEGK